MVEVRLVGTIKKLLLPNSIFINDDKYRILHNISRDLHAEQTTKLVDSKLYFFIILITI